MAAGAGDDCGGGSGAVTGSDFGVGAISDFDDATRARFLSRSAQCSAGDICGMFSRTKNGMVSDTACGVKLRT